jgi:hypothetical protein
MPSVTARTVSVRRSLDAAAQEVQPQPGWQQRAHRLLGCASAWLALSAGHASANDNTGAGPFQDDADGGSEWAEPSNSEEPALAVVSTGAQRIDLFVHDAHDGLATKRFANGGWTPASSDFGSLGGPIVGTPAAIREANDHIEVFARKRDGQLYGKCWTGAVWSDWRTLGAPAPGVQVDGRPALASRAANQLDLVVVGNDRMLYAKSENAQVWSPSATTYEPLGGPVVGDPELVSWGADRLDLFVTRDDGLLYTKSWHDAAWWPSQLEFTALGAPSGASVSAQPAVVTWGPDRLDVFVAATDGRLYIKSWTGSGWFPSQLEYNDLGAPDAGLLGAPKVVSWGPNRLDIFVRGQDGACTSSRGWVTAGYPRSSAGTRSPNRALPRFGWRHRS